MNFIDDQAPRGPDDDRPPVVKFAILLARKELGGRNPAEIPDDVPLEDWLSQNFDLIGPAESEDQAREALAQIDGLIDPEGNGARYWAILELKDRAPVKIDL